MSTVLVFFWHRSLIERIKQKDKEIKILFQSAYHGTPHNFDRTYYQEAGDSDEKLIAGFTYSEVMEKLQSIYDELYNDDNKLSKDEQTKLMSKMHVLEDAFEVSEHPDKFSNEDKRHEIMLNAYYIMNNQEIPEQDSFVFYNKKKFLPDL